MRIELDERARRDDLIHRWADIVAVGAELVCDADHRVLFVHRSVVVGELGPGVHPIDASRLPFLAPMVWTFPQGPGLVGELVYLHTGAGVRYRLTKRLRERIDPKTFVTVRPVVRGFVTLAVDRAPEVVRRLGRVLLDPDSIAYNAVDRVAMGVEAAVGDALPLDPAQWPALAGALMAHAVPKVAELGLCLRAASIEEVRIDDDERARIAARAAPVERSIEPGARVCTRRGQRFTGRVVSVEADVALVAWDGGIHQTRVGASELVVDAGSPGSHAPGTRVWAQGRPGTVRWFNGTSYEVELDVGGVVWLCPGDVRVGA